MEKQNVFGRVNGIKNWFLKRSLRTKIISLVLIAVTLWVGVPRLMPGKSAKTTYQTAKLEKGTLIVSVTASGQVSTSNSAVVNTQTSGVVKKIFVENGQGVKSGDQIAEIDLDMDGKQRAAQALSSYQSAKNGLDSANASMFSLQSTLFTQWKTYMDKAQSSTYQNPDGSPITDQRNLPQFQSTSDDWLSAEAKFKNQQSVIAQSQTAVNSAWSSYQQTSPIIYAPISGTISGLSLQIGSVLTAQTGSSGNSTAQRIANIQTVATPTVSVNLTQIDAPKVKPGNKATITLDAFPGKTYTGKVISIDTTGTVSSGVTTYPSVIQLDTGASEIFPNMSAQANIITEIKENVLLVPSGAVKTQNGQSVVSVMKNNIPQPVVVELGSSSSTDVEITSGLSEGDTIVTSTVSSAATTRPSGQIQSPFSALGGRGFGGGGGGGGGAIRRIGGD